MNDLEIAGALLGLLALKVWQVSLLFAHLAWFGDNMTSIAWVSRPRTSKLRIAGYILRYIGLRLHHLRASNLVPHHLAGDNKIMADIILREYKKMKII